MILRRGSVEIPLTVQPEYEQGRVLYQQERFSEAAAVFQRILSINPRLIPAQYWLGLSYYEQRQTTQAQQQFQQLTVLGSRLPYGYYGLGLVALRGRHRKFEALTWFRAALARDATFVDAQWQLAMTRLSLANGLSGAFALGDIRKDFERVIALAPNHPDAYYSFSEKDLD